MTGVGGVGGNGGPVIKGMDTPQKAQRSFGSKLKRFLVRVAAGIARAAFAIASPVTSALNLIDRAIRSRRARVGRVPPGAARAARALDPERRPGDPLTVDQKTSIGEQYKAALRESNVSGIRNASAIDARVCEQFVRDLVGRGGLVLTNRDEETTERLAPTQEKAAQSRYIDRFVAFCGGDKNLSFAISQFANQDTQNCLLSPLMDVLGPGGAQAGGDGPRIPYELVKEDGNYNLRLSQSFARFSCTIQIPLTRSDGRGGVIPIPRGEIEPEIVFQGRD
jgi:hypothetical protein